MDFVSRHATDHRQPPSADSPSASAPPAAAGPEELEYLARYTVVKHSWRGRYKRILCISNVAIITLDPSTLVVTNSYDVANDYEGSLPVLGRDDNSHEFTISVRTDGRGKFKGIKFSSRFRASILTELHKIRWSKIGAVAEFQVLHLRRRTSEWVPSKLKVTAVGVELIDGKSGDLRWCLDFRDMDAPAIILLADSYGKKIAEHGGFVLCPLYGRKCKAFVASSGTTNAAIISNLTKTAKSMVGVSLAVDSTQTLTTAEFIKKRAMEAVGADETPFGGWSVTRLRSAAHGTANVLGLSLGVGPKGGLGEQGDAVSRQLILTKVSLVERRPENYEAVIVRPLSAVSSLVRFAEEPQMFAIEFNDGCPIHVKIDDSVDLDLDGLVGILESHRGKKGAYIGCMKSGEIISEEGKPWYEPQWWKFGDEKSYFRHAAGSLLIISKNLARYINTNSASLQTYAHDDISVGSWMMGLEATYVDDNRLCCSSSKQDKVCSNV